MPLRDISVRCIICSYPCVKNKLKNMEEKDYDSGLHKIHRPLRMWPKS